jgi:ribosomal protein S12 methylthiotransferase
LTEAKKKFFIISLGCPKNYVDSEYICETLVASGYELLESIDEADFVIVNTCAFLEASVEESINTMLELIEDGREVICTGCLVSRYIDQLKKELPEIRIFAGPGTYNKLPDAIDSDKKYLSPDFSSVVSRSFITTPGYAYVKISEGCSNHCNYCMIPSLRGELVSKPESVILEECRNMINAGAKELILIGQDLGSYLNDEGIKDALPLLIKKICKLDGFEWLRLMYIHPASLTKKLIDIMGQDERICRYIDIPVQHVSEKVLKAMGRKGGKKAVDKSIEMLANAGIWIRTTLMVGHPGEDGRAFSELEEFVKSGVLGSMGAFAYSAESGTKSAEMVQIDSKEKQLRLKHIMNLQKKVSKEKLKTYKGSRLKVLIEGFHPESELLLKARTSFQAPEVDGITIINEGSGDFGKTAQVKISRTTDYDLIGRLI